MISRLLLLAIALGDGQELPAGRTLALTHSTRIRAGEYLRPALGEGGRDGVLRIEGQRDLELDLSGVVLRGAPEGTDLDQLRGYGIVVRDCQNVVLRGGTLAGYKGCLVAERTRGLVIEGLVCDGYYGMRLRSTPQAEVGDDWLYPHENDQGEWLANYGAAISLSDCPDAVVRGCRARHGQNGLLLTRSDGARVYDNDFSFLSGWGLALYRSSHGVVGRNRFDYCVRGYGHGVYWRGQDSAAILMFERCSDNLFALNSGTHSGDGVFLFAGQDTVAGRAWERGEKEPGGSDRNTWYRNDLSYAVANGIETTFSRGNRAIENRLNGCHQHGVWGGYSRELVLIDNEIRGTLGGGISIEHGQECVVAGNRLAGNELALELWWDEDPELVQGPFGQHFDTSSRDTLVVGNVFSQNKSDFSLRHTQGVVWSGNRVAPPPAELRAASEAELARVERERAWRCPEIPGTRDPWSSPPFADKGLDSIVMGPYGPWDFASGEPRPPVPVLGGLLAKAQWEARWFSWKGGADPRTDEPGWRALAAKPLKEARVPNFTDPWAGQAKLRASVGSVRFGLVARTKIDVPAAGPHRLAVLSDDGVRLRVDGKVVLEHWDLHAPARDEARLELAQGAHELELEYFQIDGAWALIVELERLP